jgi:hypothetical protein
MEVLAEFNGLIRNLHGILASSEASEVMEFVEARELVLAVESLCGILLDENKRITPDLFRRVHSLVRQIDGVDAYLIERVRTRVRAE